jgi:hypothetical protein
MDMQRNRRSQKDRGDHDGSNSKEQDFGCLQGSCLREIGSATIDCVICHSQTCFASQETQTRDEKGQDGCCSYSRFCTYIDSNTTHTSPTARTHSRH